METVAEHLKSRHMDLNLHRPFVDEEERVATFYLFTQTGKFAGFQQYRPDADKSKSNHPRDSRYFTYRKQPTLSVWGMESLHLSPKVLFLTEGVFDACRFTKLGYSAVASLSNNPQSDLKNWLGMLHRKVVVVCDNDHAGRRLAKFGHEAVFTNQKDLGDESEEYVKELVKTYG